MAGEMQPWKIPNFVRVNFDSFGGGAGVPVALGALPPERLDEQLEMFCNGVREKAEKQRVGIGPEKESG